MNPKDSSSRKKRYIRVIGPRLRVLLFGILVLFALLGANSAYLSSITFLEWFTGETYENYFYQLMFLGHLVLGLLIILPVIVFAGGMDYRLNPEGICQLEANCPASTDRLSECYR